MHVWVVRPCRWLQKQPRWFERTGCSRIGERAVIDCERAIIGERALINRERESEPARIRCRFGFSPR
jgi:hypothetical protein